MRKGANHTGIFGGIGKTKCGGGIGGGGGGSPCSFGGAGVAVAVTSPGLCDLGICHILRWCFRGSFPSLAVLSDAEAKGLSTASLHDVAARLV